MLIPVLVRLDEGKFRELKAVAARSGTTQASLMRQAISMYLAKAAETLEEREKHGVLELVFDK